MRTPPRIDLSHWLRCMAFLLLIAANDATAEDWTQFRGPGGTGVATGKSAPPLTWGAEENVVWKAELPGAGSSSPVIVGDRIFLTCYTGYAVPGEDDGDITQLERHLLCLDRKTGDEVWRKSVKARQPEQDRIREDHGYATSTPVVDGERVYVFFGRSGVYAFDQTDGKQLWHTDVGFKLNGWGSAASPVLAGELVIVNASVESESIVALDRKTGKKVWTAPGVVESWNAPILVRVPKGKPEQELVVAMVGKVLGFDPATGKQLWSCDTGIGWYMVPNLVADAQGVVYCIGGRSGGALAVRAGGRGDVTDSHRVWTGAKGSNVSSPVLSGGHLFWANDNNGTVYCADARTGKILYEEELPRPGQFYASAVLAGGRVYHLARDGRTFVVPAKPKFELLATNHAPKERGVFNATPAIADGRIYLRSNRFLYCIGE